MNNIADSLARGKKNRAPTSRAASRTQLDCALKLAEAGFRVFPLAPDATAPNPEWDWQQAATRDPLLILRFWTDPVEDTERPFNIGIALDADTLVIEAFGRAGVDSLCRFEAKHDLLPGTYLVRTPDRGFQHYYRLSPLDCVLAAELCDRVALKTIGDYVVGEGSRIGIHRYNRTAGEPGLLAEIPSSLIQAVRI